MKKISICLALFCTISSVHGKPLIIEHSPQGSNPFFQGSTANNPTKAADSSSQHTNLQFQRHIPPHPCQFAPPQGSQDLTPMGLPGFQGTEECNPRLGPYWLVTDYPMASSKTRANYEIERSQGSVVSKLALSVTPADSLPYAVESWIQRGMSTHYIIGNEGEIVQWLPDVRGMKTQTVGRYNSESVGVLAPGRLRLNHDHRPCGYEVHNLDSLARISLELQFLNLTNLKVYDHSSLRGSAYEGKIANGGAIERATGFQWKGSLFPCPPKVLDIEIKEIFDSQADDLGGFLKEVKQETGHIPSLVNATLLEDVHLVTNRPSNKAPASASQSLLVSSINTFLRAADYLMQPLRAING